MTVRLVKEKREDVADKISSQCSIILTQIRNLRDEINKLEIQNGEYVTDAEMNYSN